MINKEESQKVCDLVQKMDKNQLYLLKFTIELLLRK